MYFGVTAVVVAMHPPYSLFLNVTGQIIPRYSTNTRVIYRQILVVSRDYIGYALVMAHVRLTEDYTRFLMGGRTPDTCREHRLGAVPETCEVCKTLKRWESARDTMLHIQGLLMNHRETGKLQAVRP